MQTPRLILVATVGVLLALSVGGADAAGFVDILSGAAGSVGHLVDGTLALAGGVVDGTLGLAGGVVDGTLGLAGGVVNGALGIAGNAISGLGNLVNVAATDTRDLIGSSMNAIQSSMDSTTSQLQSLGNSISGTVKNAATDATNALNNAKTVLNNSAIALDSAYRNATNTIIDKLNSTENYLTEKGINATKCLGDITTTALTNIYILGNIKLAIVESIGQLLMSAANSTATSVKKALADLATCIIWIPNTCVTKAIKSIVDAAANLNAAAYNVTRQTLEQVSAINSFSNDTVNNITRRAAECIANSDQYKL